MVSLSSLLCGLRWLSLQWARLLGKVAGQGQLLWIFRAHSLVASTSWATWGAFLLPEHNWSTSRFPDLFPWHLPSRPSLRLHAHSLSWFAEGFSGFTLCNLPLFPSSLASSSVSPFSTFRPALHRCRPPSLCLLTAHASPPLSSEVKELIVDLAHSWRVFVRAIIVFLFPSFFLRTISFPFKLPDLC